MLVPVPQVAPRQDTRGRGPGSWKGATSSDQLAPEIAPLRSFVGDQAGSGCPSGGAGGSGVLSSASEWEEIGVRG